VLNTEAQLDALKHCKKVFIDTDKGSDDGPSIQWGPIGNNVPRPSRRRSREEKASVS
jgi:hypothetical protein